MSKAAIRLRRARRGDLDELCKLEQRCFTTDRISRASFRRLLKAPSATAIAAQHRERLAGYAVVLFRAGATVARLYSVAVAPEEAGRGLGRALLSAAERAARRRGAMRLRLEVRVGNRRAATLYRRNGYEPIGRREDYYEDGGAALKFEKRLPPQR